MVRRKQGHKDYPQTLQESFNEKAQAFDVNIVSDLVPEKYSKITYEFKDMGDGTIETEFINFYGNGTRNESQISLRDTFLGTAEFSAFQLISETPASLDGKYVIVYDEVGSVGIWFDLDNGSTPPTTGAARDIEVDIATGDSTSDLAIKMAVTVNLDSKFVAAPSAAMVAIQSSTIGNKTNATGGTTGITPVIIDGIDNLNDTYLYVYSANDLTEYYVWFNFNSTGTDPLIAGKTAIEIAFTNSDTFDVLSQRVSDTIGALDDFTSEYDEHILIENVAVGVTSETADVSTGSVIETTEIGAVGELVAKIQIFFDANKLIESFERII